MILILNASPQRNSNISRLLDEMEDEARQQGIDIKRVEVQHLHIQPCTGCMACRHDPHCILPPDDAHQVAEWLKQCSTLIIGSPCYWANMPGTLKVLFDRLVYILMRDNPHGLPHPLHRGKKAVIVTACGTAWPFSRWFGQSSGTIRSLRQILKWSGFKTIGIIRHEGTLHHPELRLSERKHSRRLMHHLQ